MKKIYIAFLFILFIGSNAIMAQMLNVSEEIQEQSEWCWAGVSKCILDYYGDSTLQCEIADYTKNVATWHNFGSVNCCNDASQGCNYWNYGYGYSGSIADILVFFGGIQNYGIGNILSEQTISNELSNGRPFVIRWGWYSGGGHFVIGYGKSNQTIYYMNPWFGEGMKFANYSWIKDDGIHQWTHTNVLTTSPTAIAENEIDKYNTIKINPNPSNGAINLSFGNEIDAGLQISILDTRGKEVYKSIIQQSGNSIKLNLELSNGIYFVKILSDGGIYNQKFVVLN